jgi:hypothetical protein
MKRRLKSEILSKKKGGHVPQNLPEDDSATKEFEDSLIKLA